MGRRVSEDRVRLRFTIGRAAYNWRAQDLARIPLGDIVTWNIPDDEKRLWIQKIEEARAIEGGVLLKKHPWTWGDV